MMTNLFSSFDPLTNFFFLNNWSFLFLSVLLIKKSISFNSTRQKIFLKKIWSYLYKEITTISKGNNSILLFTAMFMFILGMNWLGLYPYIFPCSSHLSITLSLGLSSWMFIMTFYILYHFQKFLAHLVPMGTPIYLIPLMVLIELVSVSVRPLTLSLRLAANIIAGHLLLTMLAQYGNILKLSIFSTTIITSSILLILESAVAIIQAYVMTLLITMYLAEI